MKNLFFYVWRVLFSIILVIFVIQIIGCSSSHGVIGFKSLNYPTSMSAFLFDENQNVVMKGRELESLYTFKYKKTFWSIAYGLIPLTKGEESINNYLNTIVDQYKGDGIINLTITIEQGAVNKFYSFLLYIPSLVPVFPSSADITVSGEVVKLMQSDSSSQLDGRSNENFISKENIHIKVNETLAKNN